MTNAVEHPTTDEHLALVLSGGGARAAYQVGVLLAIGERFPDLRIPILTGVSAGAINTAYLAAHSGTFGSAVSDLCRERHVQHARQLRRKPASRPALHRLRRNQTLQLIGKPEILFELDEPHDRTGGTRRYWDVTVERWLERELPHRVESELLDFSPFNP